MEKKIVCGEVLDLRGYSPDTILTMYQTEATPEECLTLLGWLERVYG